MQNPTPNRPQQTETGPRPVGPPPRHGPAARAVPKAPVADSTAPDPATPNAPRREGSKIRAFNQALGNRRHEDNWQRSPNVTGTGAIHVKSFHCKLTGDSLDFLDEQINEWLDAHPQYEVKMVTTSVGEWSGKAKEPNLIINVWV